MPVPLVAPRAMALPLLLPLHMHGFQMDIVCIFNQNYLQLLRFLLSAGCNFFEAIKLSVSWWLLPPCLPLQITVFCTQTLQRLASFVVCPCFVDQFQWQSPYLPPAFSLTSFNSSSPLSAPLKRRVKRYLLNTSFVRES